MPQPPPQNEKADGAEQRRGRRVFKALLARIRLEGVECYGYVHNLAKYGFGITLDQDTPVTTALQIDLKIPQRGIVTFAGRVVWQRPISHKPQKRYMIGVKLHTVPPQYLAYMDELIAQEDSLLSKESRPKTE